jgi:hypothetical protein
MTALNALDRLTFRLSRLKPSLPQQPAVREAVEHVRARFAAAPDVPPSDQLQALKARLLRAHADGTLADIPRRDWRNVPWILWGDAPRLADLPGFVDVFLAATRTFSRTSTIGRLIYVYFRDFDPTLSYWTDIASEIRLAVRQEGALDLWRERHTRLRVFTASEGPGAVAEEILASGGRIGQAESAAGLNDDLTISRFALTIHACLYDRVEQLLASGALADDALKGILEGTVDDSGFRFPQLRPKIADHLLLPWIRRTPTEAQRTLILQFLLKHYRDPRLHPRHWTGVSPSAISVVRRWLAHETLEQFFDLIDRSALDQHWRYRKAFWMSYYERGVIDDAWIVLGSHAQRDAKKVLRGDVAYGRLRSGMNVEPAHSVLILRLGNLVFAEWTHNGRCRAWPQDDPRAPLLGREEYTRAELTAASLRIANSEPGIVHRSSETGNWQRKLSDFIRRRTSISVGAHEYMPHGRSR